MENLTQQDIDNTPSYVGGMCDNCGREIEDLKKECPHCQFRYKVKFGEGGIYYV